VPINAEIRARFGELPRTLLAHACTDSRSAIAKFLIEAGARIDQGAYYPPLLAAAEMGRVPMVKMLLKNGANPNVAARFNGDPSPKYDRDTGWTSLMTAAVRNNAQLFDLLLKNGANPK
jgi:ankyrin repeat protein